VGEDGKSRTVRSLTFVPDPQTARRHGRIACRMLSKRPSASQYDVADFCFGCIRCTSYEGTLGAFAGETRLGKIMTEKKDNPQGRKQR